MSHATRNLFALEFDDHFSFNDLVFLSFVFFCLLTKRKEIFWKSLALKTRLLACRYALIIRAAERTVIRPRDRLRRAREMFDGVWH